MHIWRVRPWVRTARTSYSACRKWYSAVLDTAASPGHCVSSQCSVRSSVLRAPLAAALRVRWGCGGVWVWACGGRAPHVCTHACMHADEVVGGPHTQRRGRARAHTRMREWGFGGQGQTRPPHTHGAAAAHAPALLVHRLAVQAADGVGGSHEVRVQLAPVDEGLHVRKLPLLLHPLLLLWLWLWRGCDRGCGCG